jgi:hypothetical protein
MKGYDMKQFIAALIMLQVIVIQPEIITPYTYYSNTQTGQTGFVYSQPIEPLQDPYHSTRFVQDMRTNTQYFEFNNGPFTTIITTNND